LVINSNISATAASRTLGESAKALSASLTPLSSGSKIVSPEDDAAGLAQSIKFETQINRNHAVLSNISNAVSFSQTQDGYLQKIQVALDRISELSVLAQDVTKTNADRASYDSEYQQIKKFIYDSRYAKYNGVSLFPTTYQLVQSSLSWPESYDEALSQGGHLATITSQEETDEVNTLLEDWARGGQSAEASVNGSKITVNDASQVMVNSSDGYDTGDYTTDGISVNNLSSALSNGDILYFENGGEFVLSANASVGSTTLHGTLSGVGVANNETTGYGVGDYTLDGITVDQTTAPLKSGTSIDFGDGVSFVLSADVDEGKTKLYGTLTGGVLTNDEIGDPTTPTYEIGDYTVSGITINPTTSNLTSGYVLYFENGAKFELSANASVGDSTLYGTLTGATLTSNEVGYYHALPHPWIGATDVTNEGTFEWITGLNVGEENYNNTSHTNWSGNEPNNGSPGDGEDYIIINGDDDRGVVLPVTEQIKWSDRPSGESGDSVYGSYLMQIPDGSNLQVTKDPDGNKFTLTPPLIPPVWGAVNTVTNAIAATTRIKTSIQALADSRATVGSNLARLKATAGSVDSLNENLSAANSRIKDVDVAEESTRFARSSILVQSGTAMLSQANILPEMVLKLVG